MIITIDDFRPNARNRGAKFALSIQPYILVYTNISAGNHLYCADVAPP